jgi:hypothetical protein
METQQHLAQVSLPSFMRSNDISIADYLPVTLQFRSLRNITLQVPISSSIDDTSSVIVKKSPSLKSIHLGSQPKVMSFRPMYLQYLEASHLLGASYSPWLPGLPFLATISNISPCGWVCPHFLRSTLLQ